VRQQSDNRSRWSRPSVAGFTLIELLVVIMIITLLASIIVPSAIAVQRHAAEAASMRIIMNIHNGVEQYQRDHGDLPPVTMDNLNSAQTICLLMIGWPDDAGRDGLAAGGSNDMDEDDGADGYGWRRPDRPRGVTYGPYSGLQDAPRERYSNRPYYFVDTFGNKIWYGRIEGNDLDVQGVSVPTNYHKDSDGNAYRDDFVVFSAGANGEFDRYANDDTADDLTNFIPE
jgi:prepilin-type N-terminal cleavage/methylation domain-containing protein